MAYAPSNDNEQLAKKLEKIREKIILTLKWLPSGPIRDRQEYQLKKLHRQCHELWVKVFKQNSPKPASHSS